MRKLILTLFLIIFLSGCVQRGLTDMTVPEGEEGPQSTSIAETPETPGPGEQEVPQEPPEQPEHTCTDSDGGINPDVHGFADSTLNGRMEDYCRDDEWLHEAFCDGHSSNYTEVDCSVEGKACKEGVCMEEETTYYIQPIFFSPGKSSSGEYIEDRIEILETMMNDDRYQLSDEQRGFYTVMLNEYLNGSRDETRDEPHDGSVFTGVQGEAAMEEKREEMEVLMSHVKEFYRYHTGRTLNIKPVIAVIGEEAMMYYWHPVIHSFDNIDHNALGNTISEELERRGILSRDKKFQNVIQVLLVEGAGGWAGAGGCGGYGDLLVGELVTSCLSYPDEPARDSEGREKWANHIYYGWEVCTYNQALGTLVHELGHTFGLPHPESCSNYQETLVMMCHWNFDMSEPGFMKNPENVEMDYVGIMKDSSKCDDPRHHDYAYRFKEGYPLDCMPGSGYHSELELLLDNPQFNQ